VLIVFLISTVVLRGAAMASRRTRLATRAPLQTLWDVIGSAGRPPRDQSKKFAVVAIVVTTLTWFVIPAVIALVLLTSAGAVFLSAANVYARDTQHFLELLVVVAKDPDGLAADPAGAHPVHRGPQSHVRHAFTLRWTP
jgi:hypothetical protein